MDSPESTIPSAGDATETVPVQDSPIFSCISNLSPIQPVNEPGVSQGFTAPNSPVVFRSPRLNPQSQSSLLKRSGFPPFPSAKLSGLEGSFRVTITPPYISRKLDADQGSGLNTCMEKGLDSSKPVDNQTGNPLGCTDRFFADVYMDSFNSNVSAEASLKYPDNTDQPQVGMDSSKESARILECRQDARGNEQSTTVALSAITNQREEVRMRDASVDKIAIGTDMMPKDRGVPADQVANLEPSFSENLAPCNKHPGNFVTENAEAGQTSHVDEIDYLLSRSVTIYEGNENSLETGGALTGVVPHEVQNNSMVAQHHGLLVRCLQFDDVLKQLITDNHAQTPSGIESSSRPLFSSVDMDGPPTPIGQTAMTQHMVYPRNRGNYSNKVPMPLGIGLHLNSVVSTMQVGAGETIIVKSSDKGNFTTLDEQVTPPSSHLSENSKKSSFLPLPESVLGSAGDGRRHASLSSSSANSLSSYDTKHLENSVVYNPIEDHSTPILKRKSSTGNAADAVKFNKPSPKKKTKKTSESNDDYSCQRCNCKKSKCLKLYCDCFAAGIYCAEPCSCQGCFNRPEYEDTVLETRQQIESRNPLAFAPKIVQNLVEPPSSIYKEDETQLSKPSGRHKRGCNCKKSMCLKKYCECYQAKVGCSDGCRCEGCKNVYGQKGEHAMNMDVGMQGTSETTDGSFAETLEMEASGNALYHNDLCNPHQLTPLTPSFEYSDQGKVASKAWFSSEQVPFDHEIYQKAAVNDFSSDYHGHGNMKLLDDRLNAQQWENNLKGQPLSGSGQFPPPSSLRWRGSPTTPVAQFSGTKLPQSVDFYDGVHDVVEDDTPEILKETPNAPNAVKVSSPNKKRVSPPHSSHLHEQGSSSSAGLRIARKFILQAVPSFPPLTPCVESKNDEQEKT